VAPLLPVTTIAHCHRSVARLVAGSILCALVLVGTSTLAGAAPSKASAAKISAHLTKKSFTQAQVEKVELVCSFSTFGYRLSFKKSSKWLTVKNVKKAGTLRGPHKTTVKELFAETPVKVGEYRLGLSSGPWSKLLSFTVTNSEPANAVLPSISGATRQGQALAASRGSWKFSPTSYIYQWRRCDSSGASCTNISGANASSYTLTAAAVAGSTVRVVATASNSYGSASATSAPMTVGTTVMAISAGDHHTCALSSRGTVKCWGYNYGGELGNGSELYLAKTGSSTPVQVKAVSGRGALSSVTQISAGGDDTCALLAGGTVNCWGYNTKGQLGDGATTNSSIPVQVKDAAGTGLLTNVTQISVGRLHACALLRDQTVECWGANYYGQLGNGATTQRAIPVQVKDEAGTGRLSNVTQISAGGFHTCALLGDHTVECWGDNHLGQLGNGTTVGSSMPLQVKDAAGTGTLSNVTQISAAGHEAGFHTCALLSDRTVECWGFNAEGQLGNGVQLYLATTDNSTPVQVNNATGTGALSNVTQISPGGSHTCALLSDNTVECWGYDLSGQLGNGTATGSSTPVQVKDAAGTGTLSNVTLISAGGSHTCAVLSDNTVECWGYNEQGQLGNGVGLYLTTTDRSTPVRVKGVGGLGTF